MKFKFLYTLFGLSILAFAISSNSGGRATAANSGNTTAPGDAGATCITCHGNSSAIQVTLDIEVTDDQGNPPDPTYMAGQVYDVKVTINVAQGTPAGFGFQMVCLNGELNANAPDVPNWSDLGSNVQMATASNGRTYVEHNGVGSSNEFTMKWTAPPTGSGTVTFYACGNGVNGNGSTGGDNAACNTLTIAETDVVSTNELADELGMKVFPNPAVDFTTLSTNSSTSERFQLRLTDVQGKLLKDESLLVPAGQFRHTVNVQTLPSGIYYLQLTDGKEIATRKLLKL
ncbi:MAG: choice-of-anchor V domain-containing protein [Bacteroidota bacterium]